MKIFIVLFSVLFSLQSSAGARKSEDNLTSELAQVRRKQITNVDYDVHIVLKKGASDYSGQTVLKVDLADKNSPLSIDFKTKKINSLKVNGADVTDFKTDKGFIEIAPKYLAPKVEIAVDYVGEFSKEGDGFQRVEDPEDKSEYIYSDFEPYGAHTLIPCFDQPDLKARFKVTVEAPQGWLAIGNELIESVSTAGGVTKSVFKQTSKLSTYLFFVGAGDFVIFKDVAGKTPLELYARKSLKKYVDAERIFSTTKKGLAFYGEYFGVPYPFSKYGQVFVPEFAWGGMENPGAVTLNEKNIYRGKPTQKDLDNRNDLILHEMAHMWFGDFVTMKWWNDLWLNESFATYLANIAQDRALGAKGVWLDFHSEKGWGYWQDQLSTTHPIETPVRDVRSAKGNFDGITYAKGAASLKQLHFFVGEKGFANGLKSYFQKYSFKNTVRSDFTDEIANASKVDLTKWTRAWLQTAGPHRIKLEWACDPEAKVISEFNLIQLQNTSGVLSPHRTRLAFYSKNARGKLERTSTLDISFDKRENEIEKALGLTCPDFMYANADDQDYGLFALDTVSLKNAEEVLKGNLGEPLTRIMVWNTLNQMVRDTELRVSDYINMVLTGVESEKDPELLSILLGKYSAIRETYFHYLTRVQRVNMAPKFEKLIWEKVLAGETSADMKMVYFDFYTSIAVTTDSVARLSSILEGKTKVQSVDMDQDRRWAIVKTLARLDAPSALVLIASEEKRDPSATGKRNAETSRVSLPTADAKAAFWRSLDNAKDIPYSTLREASGKFVDFDHPEMTQKYVQPFFERVRKLNWEDNDNLVEIYFERLFPHNLCSKELLSDSRRNLGAAKTLTPYARRSWVEANDELSKCASIRAADKAPLKASPN